MRGAWTIAKREVRSLFQSPVAYVAIVIFLLLRSAFFTSQLIQLESARVDRTQVPPDLETVIRGMYSVDLMWAFMMVIPLLTMRSLAEERSQQTAPVILTAPVGTAQIVLGKFLGAMVVVGLAVLVSLNMPGVVIWYGAVSPLLLLGGLASAALLAALFVSVGLLASSLTENLFVAALLGLSMNFCLYLVGTVVTRIPLIGGDLDQFAISDNLGQLASGVIDTAPVIFFLTGTAFFLFLTARVVESQRWR